MNAKVKELWIKELLFSEKKRGSGSLRLGKKSNRYCCLGVLCDIYGQQHGLKNNGWDDTVFCAAKDQENAHVDDEDDVHLPQKVRKWAGLTKEQEEALIKINDSLATRQNFEPVVSAIKHLIPSDPIKKTTKRKTKRKAS